MRRKISWTDGRTDRGKTVYPPPPSGSGGIINFKYIVNCDVRHSILCQIIQWGKADDRNCNYGLPKMADVESGKNLFCRLNCFYNVFQMAHALVR